VITIGCADPTDPFGVVQGQVTFEGNAVPKAMVVFEAKGSPLTITADADASGHYQARRSAEMAGLPPGEYRVSVTPPLFYPGLGPAGAKPPQRDDIPPKYRDAATSGLSLNVSDAQEQVFDIAMSL
jgi:hypothetical protein